MDDLMGRWLNGAEEPPTDKRDQVAKYLEGLAKRTPEQEAMLARLRGHGGAPDPEVVG